MENSILQKKVFIISLRINYPKINHKYNIILYIREEENDPNLSNPLKIVINIKESYEERIRREQEEEERKIQEQKKGKRQKEETQKKEDEEKKRINKLFDKKK